MNQAHRCEHSNLCSNASLAATTVVPAFTICASCAWIGFGTDSLGT